LSAKGGNTSWARLIERVGRQQEGRSDFPVGLVSTPITEELIDAIRQSVQQGAIGTATGGSYGYIKRNILGI